MRTTKHQLPEVSRVAPYYHRAAIAQNALDASRFMLPEYRAHGLYDCLDAVDEIPRGGFAYATVIGSFARCGREQT